MKKINFTFLVFLFWIINIGDMHGQTYYQGIPRFVPDSLEELNSQPWVKMSHGPFHNPDTTMGYSTGTNATHTIITTSIQDSSACFDGLPGVYLSTMPPNDLLPDWDEEVLGPIRTLKLGDDKTYWSHGDNGFASSRITYHFIPDSTSNVLIVYFAFVAQNSNHAYKHNPFFHINVLTASGQPAIPGAKNSYFLVNPQGSSPSPNPEVSLPETAYNFCEASDQYLMHQWIQWIPVAFDLRNRIGEQVKLQVTTQDCMPSAHYAYGYFAARGVNGSMRVSACDSDNIFLTVPSGFESYKWYCNGAPLPVAASHELKRERDSTATYFECKAVSYTGAIISFTATVNYNEILPDGTLIADTICEGNDYWFGGEYLTSSGIYTDTLQNAHGCNSVTTLNLTVIPRLGEIGSIQGDANITEPGTYSYSIPAVENAIHYQWKVSNNKWIISDSGNNASVRIDSSGSGIVSVWVSNNCDTITSQLSIHADITSIPTHTPHGISFYPNPTYGEVEVKIENPNLNVSGIDIYDVYGKWLKRVQVTSSLTKVSLSEYANGTYLLRIATDDTPAGVFKVVKR